MGLLTLLARRFVAGSRPEDAVVVGQRLGARGVKATFDRLGEDVLDREAAMSAATAAIGLVKLIPDDLDRNISIKLSSMGQQIDEDFCLENVTRILDAAREHGGFVRLDMEGSKTTERTLSLFRKLRVTHENVGIVLQAYLHRTEDDVRAAIERKDRVRLCKGAYREPEAIAWHDMDLIRESFLRSARLLLERGRYPAIATHDEELIQATLAFVKEKGIDPKSFEFQMLYGLRSRRWDELVAAGYNVRIYVPYGTHWFPYFYRRLRERKENVLFVLRNLLRG